MPDPSVTLTRDQVEGIVKMALRDSENAPCPREYGLATALLAAWDDLATERKVAEKLASEPTGRCLDDPFYCSCYSDGECNDGSDCDGCESGLRGMVSPKTAARRLAAAREAVQR